MWGSGTLGIDVVPSPKPLAWRYCWLEPLQERWEDCQRYLKAFIEVLSYWEDLPSELRGVHQQVMDCDANKYASVLSGAVLFYVHMFIVRYGHLLSPPVCSLQP